MAANPRKQAFTFLDLPIVDTEEGTAIIATRIFPSGRVFTVERVIDANDEDYGRATFSVFDLVIDDEYGLTLSPVEEIEQVLCPTPNMMMRYIDRLTGTRAKSDDGQIMYKYPGDEPFITLD